MLNRREKLLAKHREIISKTVRKMSRKMKLRDLIDPLKSFEHPKPIESFTEEEDPVRTEAERALQDAFDLAGVTDLRSVLRNAILEAEAEGQADAAAFIEQLASNITVDFSLKFDQALASLRDLDSLWTKADSWIPDFRRGIASDVGSILADGVANGLSRTALEAAVADYFDNPAAAEFYTGAAIGMGLSDGAIELYRSEGIDQVDFVTVGDDRVDEECDDAESGSPYNLDDAPVPPIHGTCRCVLVASSTGEEVQL
ncbi:MAG: structural protein [Actinomycetota bacterium]